MDELKRGLKSVFFICTILLIVIPFVSAGFFFDIWSSITGMAQFDTTNVTVSVGNTGPNITYISQIATQQVSYNGIRYVLFNFTAYDANGADDLNANSAVGSFINGSIIRSNASCINTTTMLSSEFYVNFSCTIGVHYFDTNGYWVINASIDDASGSARVSNTTLSFLLDEGKAMVMTPNAISWSGVSSGGSNYLSNENITINNTGNANLTNVSVLAIDLQGVTDTDEFIGADNFSSSISYSCDSGPILSNNTAINITGSFLPPGNRSQGTNGTEVLHFCLEAVPFVSNQDFRANGTESWTIRSDN